MLTNLLDLSLLVTFVNGKIGIKSAVNIIFKLRNILCVSKEVKLQKHRLDLKY